VCDKCLPNFICPGGYEKLLIESGYWRESEDSLEAFFCKNNKDVCVFNGECQEGYKGRLCEECDNENDFFKSGKGRCSKC
jgi:hypothetical protein